MRLFGWLSKNPSTTALAPSPSVSEQLITAIVSGELKRRELADVADQRRSEIELKKMELEMSHLSELGEERRKDAVEKQRLRELRQQAAQNARAAKAAKRNGHQADQGICRVCVNDKEPSLTADEILWHHAGHRAPVQQWQQ